MVRLRCHGIGWALNGVGAERSLVGQQDFRVIEYGPCPADASNYLLGAWVG